MWGFGALAIKKIAAYYATSTKGSEGAKTGGVTIERLLDAYWQPHPIEDAGKTIYKAMPDLLPLEFYRRRAWSRRNRALLAFIEIRNRTERCSAPVLGVHA